MRIGLYAGTTCEAKSTVVQTCSKCNQVLPLNSFHFRKDTNKYRTICKSCWKYQQAAKRYNISFEQAIEWYKQPHCMCCKSFFKTMKERNLHHVNHKVKGVVCKECNILLGQETIQDLHRLEACLWFMQQPRENLFDRVNQQGSRSQERRSGPSTTARPTPLRVCKCCGKRLPLKHFYKQKYQSGKYGYYRACKQCYKILVKTSKYGLTFEQVQYLRSKQQCDCCGESFNKKPPYIHHVGGQVLGVVCRLCNLYLGQEDINTRKRIQACIRWIKGDDTVCSTLKDVEVSRNDLPHLTVSNK